MIELVAHERIRQLERDLAESRRETSKLRREGEELRRTRDELLRAVPRRIDPLPPLPPTRARDGVTPPPGSVELRKLLESAQRELAALPVALGEMNTNLREIRALLTLLHRKEEG